MVPDVQKRLAEREADRVASHQQVEETQESEDRGGEDDIVQVSPGQDTQDTQQDHDHQDTDQVDCQRQGQAPSSWGRRNGILRIGSGYPAGGKDPDQGDDDNEGNPQAVSGEATDQMLHGYADEKAKPDEAHNPERAGRQDPAQKSASFQPHGPSHQRGVNAESGQQA